MPIFYCSFFIKFRNLLTALLAMTELKLILKFVRTPNLNLQIMYLLLAWMWVLVVCTSVYDEQSIIHHQYFFYFFEQSCLFSFILLLLIILLIYTSDIMYCNFGRYMVYMPQHYNWLKIIESSSISYIVISAAAKHFETGIIFLFATCLRTAIFSG